MYLIINSNSKMWYIIAILKPPQVGRVKEGVEVGATGVFEEKGRDFEVDSKGGERVGDGGRGHG